MPLPPLRRLLCVARAIIAAAALVVPCVAQAQFLDSRPGIAFARAALQVCGGDIARFCGGVVPGKGRITQCLASHHDKLSPECRRVLGEAKSARNATFACAADARRLCASTLPGGGRIVSCLNSQRDALSPDCARALDEAAAIGR